ncbi:hypothetical protein DICPUDRAFT_95866 [Dictyostelium purpureum]|uniref:Cytosolic endo-beta-N-acetylglucosaminidase TIM barrel domain-containing protein n=1 Tax=Dictyostelium purpureum TaxID=5786 RepID=F1A1T5_DICPU|nr:uncharacterized protein DICPUDRAFT_95866 [Dictyostelium purpureum]EGC29850.1 hypothetical protein DICPUDRAFT_95866 [Dictyostelium purpureum]|eukprot:XP_003293624.1 hypothetical protein DICPUDRAFT_95866 [Dictyostelium purpureum]
MNSYKLFDQIILGNKDNNNEITIPWRNIVKENSSIEKNFNHHVYKSISFSTWVYMEPLDDNHLLYGNSNNSSDSINHTNRILSQKQSDGKLELGIFLGNELFDKRLYNINTPNRTSLESVYHQNKDELKYYNWEFLIFKLNFNESGNRLKSTEIYLNFKIYKQFEFEKEIEISNCPLVLGNKEMLHQIIYSNLTIHFNDRHDTFSLLSTSTFTPTYPPNLQNRNLQNFFSLRETVKPLDSLLELINWKENKPINHDHNHTHNNNNKNINKNIPLQNRKIKSSLDPRRIHCHDMKNGYQLDRYPQGFYYNTNTNIGSNGDQVEEIFLGSYNFYYWNLIDIFIYFSHHRISLPPASWVNTAHKNGVKVLGTIIFEWEQSYKEACLIVNGIQDNCQESGQEQENYFIQKLVEICKYYKFDGWFLNLETALLQDSTIVLKYQKFLSDLTKEMHKAIPGSLVIWYDSVTQSGELKWQNALTNENIEYFNSCDGIFLNYTWNEKLLKESKELLDQQPEKIKQRNLDVQPWTTVWGRGTFGGGNFNTSVGLNEANKNDLSSAIFAPGWTFESTPSSNKSIIEKERTLWLGNNGVRNILGNNSSAENGDFKDWKILTNENSYYKWSVSNGSGLNGGNCFTFSRARALDSSNITEFKKVIDLHSLYSKDLLEQIPIIEFEFYYKFLKPDQSNTVSLSILDENNRLIKQVSVLLDQINGSLATLGEFRKYSTNISDYKESIKYIQVTVGSNENIGNDSNCEILLTGFYVQVLLNNNLTNEPSIRSVTNERIPVVSLPFSSSFNRGKGKKYWEKGLILNKSAWFNLSDQDITDSSEDYRNQFGSNLIYYSTSYDLSFQGGSSLNIKGKLNSCPSSSSILIINKNTLSSVSNLNLNQNFTISTLFKIDVPLSSPSQKEDVEESLLVTFTWSANSNSGNRLCLILVLSDENENKEINIILHPSSIKDQEQKLPFNINNSYEDQTINDSFEDKVIIGTDIDGNSVEWHHSKFSLNIDDYSFNLKNLKLKEIKSLGYSISSPKEETNNLYNIYLGEITLELYNNNNNNGNNIKISNLDIDQVWNIYSMTENYSNSDIYDLILNWNVEGISTGSYSNTIKYTNIYIDNKWIGKSYSNGFYLIKNVQLKSLTQSSIITLELINNLNNPIYKNNFKIFQ